jgi:hypothetical protein
MISNKYTILTKSVCCALIGIINSLSIPSAFGQQTNCSNYWVNPNTGKQECFGQTSTHDFVVTPENSGTTFNYYDPFQKAKESLDESCISIWLKVSENLRYGSRKYNILEESYEQCKVAQDKLRSEQWEQERKEREQEQKETTARWEKEREETNPEGFCISPQSDNSITELEYSTCSLLTLALGRAKTKEILANSTSASNSEINQLKQLCEEGAIKPSLKAPSTAIFSGSETTTVANGIYSVRGNVDAQNSYGAMLRNKYSCIFSHSNSGFHLVYDNLFD